MIFACTCVVRCVTPVITINSLLAKYDHLCYTKERHNDLSNLHVKLKIAEELISSRSGQPCKKIVKAWDIL